MFYFASRSTLQVSLPKEEVKSSNLEVCSEMELLFSGQPSLLTYQEVYRYTVAEELLFDIQKINDI